MGNPKDEWKDNGWTNDPGNWPVLSDLPGGHEHSVTNTSSGEDRTVHVHDGQSVGEAIANGQWTDNDNSD